MVDKDRVAFQTPTERIRGVTDQFDQINLLDFQ